MQAMTNQRPPFGMHDISTNQNQSRAANPGFNAQGGEVKPGFPGSEVRPRYAANDVRPEFASQEKNSFGIHKDTGRFDVDAGKTSDAHIAYNRAVRET